MPEKRKVGLKRESRSGNVYRGQRTKREMRGSGGEAVKECRASERHMDSAHTEDLYIRRIVEKLNPTAMPVEGKIRQHNSMELPGKPGQEASGNKEVGCELKLRVNRARWKQNLLETGWQREQESRWREAPRLDVLSQRGSV